MLQSTTPCIHPDAAATTKITLIKRRYGWLGEIDGLTVSLAGADQKHDELATRSTTTHLGMPQLTELVGRTHTTDT